MCDQPLLLGREGLATLSKWAENRAAARGQVGPPVALRIGFDVTGTLDGQWAEGGQVDGL
jgi:hypothetical protein